MKHFCSCNNDQSHFEYNNVSNNNNMMKFLSNSNETSQKSSKEESKVQNKTTIIVEKNYDLPLKRDNFETSSKMTVNNFVQQPVKKFNTLKPQPSQKDYSKKLTNLINKENEGQKPVQNQRPKKLTVDINKSLFLEHSNDYSTVKSKEISTTKAKQIPSKSPNNSKKQEFFKRNRSVSRKENNSCSTNILPKPELDSIPETKNLTPLNNHLIINNMIGVLNLPSSIECTICRKIINVTEFVEHLNQCAGIDVENPSDLNNPHNVFSDISNIQHNLSFNTSSENPEIEKKSRFNGAIHESITNERIINRKFDDNFFSLAPGLLNDCEIGNLIKIESNRYADSPSAINMTNEFSTSHKKGLVQDSLINSSFVIRSMNEIKRNSKK